MMSNNKYSKLWIVNLLFKSVLSYLFYQSDIGQFMGQVIT